MPSGNSPILQSDLMAEGDTNKHILFNNAIVKLEDAANRLLEVNMTSGNVTLTEFQFLNFAVFRCSGHTVDRTLTVPDEVGNPAVPSNRQFTVRNAGSADILITHGGSGTTVSFSAGEASVMHTDGTDIVALGAGVAGLALAIEDEGVNITTNANLIDFVGGLVVVTDGTNGMVTVTIDFGSFIDQTDTPAAFTGAEMQSLRVNATADALEFFTPPTPLTTFTSLTDTPAVFTGEAGQFLRINAGETAVEFVDPPAGVATFAALTDTPATFTGEAGQFLRVNAGETAVEYVDPPAGVATFTGLTDTPAAFTGEGGRFLRVNAGATALEFVDAPAGGGGLITATYWRITNLICANTDRFSIATIVYRDAPNGNILTPSTVSAFNEFSAGFAATAAIDTDNATFWASVDKNAGMFFQAQFTTAVNLGEISITARPTTPDQTPQRFTIEYSNNGTSWTVAGTTTEAITAHTSNVARNFDVSSFTDIGVGATSLDRKTANYTLVDGDLDGLTIIEMNLAGANTMTVAPSLTGTEPVTVIQYGVGVTTITAGTGVTLNAAGGLLALRTRFSSCTIIKVSATEYHVIGDLA